MTPTGPSTLYRKNPDGSEQRICGCGDHYCLPLPYEKANPRIRDMCPVCLSQWQDKQPQNP
jgi:hypothetical protein